MCHIFIFSTPHVAFHLRQPRLPSAVMTPVAPPAPAVPMVPMEATAPRCGSSNVTGHVVWVSYGHLSVISTYNPFIECISSHRNNHLQLVNGHNCNIWENRRKLWDEKEIP